MNFAKLLEKYRLMASPSPNPTTLARRIGVHPSYIMKMEKGAIPPPPLGQVKAIAAALNLSDIDYNTLLEAAINERFKDELAELGRVFGSKNNNIAVPDTTMSIRKVPVISWVAANHMGEAVDSYQPGDASDWVYSTINKDGLFALEVNGDCMEPEFTHGDIIVVDPSIEPEHNDFVVVRDNHNDTATFKQFRRAGERVILHPLNPKYEDIFPEEDRWAVCGKVVQQIKAR